MPGVRAENVRREYEAFVQARDRDPELKSHRRLIASEPPTKPEPAIAETATVEPTAPLPSPTTPQETTEVLPHAQTPDSDTHEPSTPEPAPPSRRRLIIALAMSTTILAALVAGLAGFMFGPQLATSDDDPSEDGAPLAVDDAPSAPIPAPAPEPPTPQPEPPTTTEETPAPPDEETSTAPDEETPAPNEEPGRLRIVAIPEGQITVDGRKPRALPSNGLALARYTHGHRSRPQRTDRSRARPRTIRTHHSSPLEVPVNRSALGALALIACLLPGTAAAQGTLAIVPATPDATSASNAESVAEALRRAVRSRGTPVLAADEMLHRFRQRHSAEPADVETGVYEELSSCADDLLVAVASGRYRQAQQTGVRCRELAESSLESLNRRTQSAREVLDACLYVCAGHHRRRLPPASERLDARPSSSRDAPLPSHGARPATERAPAHAAHSGSSP